MIARMSAGPLTGKRICIDPGHGGEDPGAIGPSGLTEKSVNLAIALDVRDELRSYGADVVMTRDTDRSVAPPGSSHVQELQARCDVATKAKADVFVSVHNNANPNAATRGTETYHSRNADDASKFLAHSIYDKMTAQLPVSGRGVFPSDFYVIYHATMPAELTEVAFISNPDEEKLLASPYFQKKAAHAIGDGIVSYFHRQESEPASTLRPPAARAHVDEPLPETAEKVLTPTSRFCAACIHIEE